MFGLFCYVLAVLASPFKSKSRLEAENAALRRQLVVLRRKVQGRIRLRHNDRWFLIQLYRWFPSILQVVTIVQPETPARDTNERGLRSIGDALIRQLMLVPDGIENAATASKTKAEN